VASTWANWDVLARTYVVPVLGEVTLQQLSAPQLQAFYGHLLTAGRVKADLGPTMFETWRRLRDEGKEPTARQVAAATGASIHVVREADARRPRIRWSVRACYRRREHHVAQALP